MGPIVNYFRANCFNDIDKLLHRKLWYIQNVFKILKSVKYVSIFNFNLLKIWSIKKIKELLSLRNKLQNHYISKGHKMK